MWDRGGSPLHFLLAHATFAVDASPSALRWLSLLLALATVVVVYDLGRRLGGELAGVVAAIVCAGSGMFAVHATFGRMYSLLALAGALAGDTFVRALHRRTSGAAALAAGAAWLLPASHPYGGLVLGVEALVALCVWRGRPWRTALPVGAIVLATLPFVLADARLAARFHVGDTSEGHVATAGQAWDQLAAAVRGFAGGSGLALVLALALAAIGVVVLAERQRAFLAFAGLALVAPPLLSWLAPRGGTAPDLSPRHLIYALPLWSAILGVGATRLVARRRGAVRIAFAGAVALLVVLAPRTVTDPRGLTFIAPLSTRELLAPPADWLRTRVERDDLLFPYSSVYLAALPEAQRGHGLPRAEVQPLLDTLHRAGLPVPDVFVAVPIDGVHVDLARLRSRLGPRYEVARFEAWLLVRARGPFASDAEVLHAIESTLLATRAEARGPIPQKLGAWFDLAYGVTHRALALS